MIESLEALSIANQIKDTVSGKRVEGVLIRFHRKNEPRPARYQLLLECNDHTALHGLRDNTKKKRLTWAELSITAGNAKNCDDRFPVALKPVSRYQSTNPCFVLIP